MEISQFSRHCGSKSSSKLVLNHLLNGSKSSSKIYSPVQVYKHGQYLQLLVGRRGKVVSTQKQSINNLRSHFLLPRLIACVYSPSPQNGGGIFLNYFEVMTANIWLPEDILTGIAKYSNGNSGSDNTPGLWGTQLGTELRQWYGANGTTVFPLFL